MKKSFKNSIINPVTTRMKISATLIFCLFGVLNISAQEKNKPPTIKQVSKNFKIRKVEKIKPLLVDSVSKYGVYRAIYSDEDDQKLGMNFLYVKKRFYNDIKISTGIDESYNTGYYKLMEYFNENQMKEVERFFLKTYPPKI
jgi:hypothetical protein